MGAPVGKKLAIFVDDVNMPKVSIYGSMDPVELLRQVIEKKGIYERKQWVWKNFEDMTLLAATAPPSGGRNPLCQRFTRHFNFFCLP